ncbi:hypothetical protein [Rothia nasimurium]|uniref:hypothetical protein n=1 Tax=Rothia nasimurium TaxID=85336 RepID=UPI001F30E874|nr:hypothetical protein [Rothia nasimurium]
MLFVTDKRIRAILALTCLAGTGLVGCTPEPENFKELTAAEAKSEHIDQLQTWIYPPAESEEARRAFVQRCVKAAGGSYTEAVSQDSLADAVFTGRSTAALKENGYDLLQPTQSETVASFDQAGLDAYLGTGGETFSVSFMEYSTGTLNSAGCMAQSYEYIYGSVEAGIKAALLAPSFGQAIADSLFADENYTTLQNSWASCMNDRGFAQVSSTDQASYEASLLGEKAAQDMLAADISCRETLNFDAAMTDLKNSYYESVYKRLKQFSEELTTIHETSLERVAADATDPKDTSPVTVPTPSPSPTAG